MAQILTFEDFWEQIQQRWKELPTKEKNFRKRIGLDPNLELAQQVWRTLKQIPDQQTELSLNQST